MNGWSQMWWINVQQAPVLWGRAVSLLHLLLRLNLGTNLILLCLILLCLQVFPFYCSQSQFLNQLFQTNIFRIHMGKAHIEKSHKCGECGKTFAHYHQYKVHLSTHAQKTTFSCKVKWNLLVSEKIVKHGLERTLAYALTRPSTGRILCTDFIFWGLSDVCTLSTTISSFVFEF